MAFCRVIDGRVVEVWHVSELPPLTAELAALYVPCDDIVEEGYAETSPGVFEPFVPAVDVEALRLEVINSIKKYATNLMAAQIEALQSFEMVGFLAEIWAHLVDPATNTDLDYCKDVYIFAKNEISLAKTATQAQLEGYDITSRPWPTPPA